MKPILRDPASGEELQAIEIIDSDSGSRLGEMDAARTMEALRCGNLTMDTDLYELTMAAGYKVLGREDQRACFDLYYRQNPDDGAFCVFAGLDSVINYIKNLQFYPDDIEYLASTGVFSKKALDPSSLSWLCRTG